MASPAKTSLTYALERWRDAYASPQRRISMQAAMATVAPEGRT